MDKILENTSDSGRQNNPKRSRKKAFFTIFLVFLFVIMLIIKYYSAFFILLVNKDLPSNDFDIYKTSGWNVYRNEELGIEFTYPNDLYVELNKERQHIVITNYILTGREVIPVDEQNKVIENYISFIENPLLKEINIYTYQNCKDVSAGNLKQYSIKGSGLYLEQKYCMVSKNAIGQKYLYEQEMNSTFDYTSPNFKYIKTGHWLSFYNKKYYFVIENTELAQRIKIFDPK